MPYNWMRIPSSPPAKRRDQVRKICEDYGGRLVEDQTFYDETGQAYALVYLPDDDGQVDGLVGEIGATSWKGLVHADEMAGGRKPPQSKKRDQRP
jgi:hypothetical protein